MAGACGGFWVSTPSHGRSRNWTDGCELPSRRRMAASFKGKRAGCCYNSAESAIENLRPPNEEHIAQEHLYYLVQRGTCGKRRGAILSTGCCNRLARGQIPCRCRGSRRTIGHCLRQTECGRRGGDAVGEWPSRRCRVVGRRTDCATQ